MVRFRVKSDLRNPLPGLFPHPPTRPASVVPLMTQARRGADYIGRRGRTPEISSRRSSARGPGAARPITQKRRTDRAHNAPVLAVHVDDRPTPGVSIDTPLFLCGSGGWGRKVSQWLTVRSSPHSGNVRSDCEINLGSYFLSDLQLIRIAPGYSSVLRSPQAR